MQQQGRVRIGLSLLVWFVQHSPAPCINREVTNDKNCTLIQRTLLPSKGDQILTTVQAHLHSTQMQRNFFKTSIL